jgi:hypothetical protein
MRVEVFFNHPFSLSILYWPARNLSDFLMPSVFSAFRLFRRDSVAREGNGGRFCSGVTAPLAVEGMPNTVTSRVEAGGRVRSLSHFEMRSLSRSTRERRCCSASSSGSVLPVTAARATGSGTSNPAPARRPREQAAPRLSGISPVVFVVGPVRDEHRRGVESHAAVLERSLWTSDLEGQGGKLI